MLREAVSSLGLTFFPIAALILFVLVYCAVIGRSFLKHRRDYWNDMAHMALDEPATSTKEQGS